MDTSRLRETAYRIHDTDCNQKYDKTLPYSFHLAAAERQFEKFKHLIPKGVISNPDNFRAITRTYSDVALVALFYHDAIEDTHVSYNDLKEICELDNAVASERVAEIVYLCSEDKGRSRAERKSEKWYKELATDELAAFVKLCDITANTKYSLLQNSSMFAKYKDEYYKKVKPFLYSEQYAEMFNYLEKIYEL